MAQRQSQNSVKLASIRQQDAPPVFGAFQEVIAMHWYYSYSHSMLASYTHGEIET